MKVYANRSITRNAVEVLLRTADCAIEPVHFVLKPYATNELMEPTFTLPMDVAQQLMQELWDQGFRPNNGAGSGAEAEALKNHIKFAETIALTALRPALPSSPAFGIFDPNKAGVEIKNY